MMRRRQDAGYTLVELAVVVLVVGIIVAFGLPGLARSITTNNLHNSSQVLIGEMNLARQKAITNSKQNWVWFATGGTTYWTLQSGEGWKGPFSLPSRVTIANPNFSSLNYFWYGADGKPNTSGYVALVNTAGQRDTVNLDLSGSVWR